MRIIFKVLSVIAVISALNSCSGAKSVRDESDSSSSYSPDRIQRIAATDYDGAMHLVEEGLIKGQLSAFKANELRSNLTYQYTEDYPAAARWLRKALEQDEAQDPSTRTELLYHLATILKSDRDFTSCLAVCAEGKELSHSIGHIYKEYSFDFLAGSCLFAIGEDDPGLSMMRDAIAGATGAAGSEAQYGHLIYFVNTLIDCQIEIKDFTAALEECSVNESLIARMEKGFPNTSPAYLDRCRFYLDLNRATCYAGTGETRKAADNFSAALGRGFASSEGGKIRLVDYYAVIGDPDGILKIYEEFPYTEADTVSRGYRVRIARLRDAYGNAGLKEEERILGERHDRLSALLEEKENAEGIREKAARYDAQQYQLALSDTLSSLRKYRHVIMLLIGLIVVAFILFVILNQRVNRRKEERHLKETASLENDVRSLQKQVSLIAKRELCGSVDGDGHKKVSFPELIEGQKLYLNKSLNRENAASLLGMSQTEISKALAGIEPDLSFPDYIKGLRIREALKLIGENPDISIAELADRCGFYTTRTLQRSFHAVTGKTPSEYARGLKGKA